MVGLAPLSTTPSVCSPWRTCRVFGVPWKYIIEDYHRVVMNGLHMPAWLGDVCGAWGHTRLIGKQDNGIRAIFNIILAGGTEPLTH